jgi:hypothetical protein
VGFAEVLFCVSGQGKTDICAPEISWGFSESENECLK